MSQSNIDLSSVPGHARRAAKYDFFKVLQNGRIRYYDSYRPAKKPGRTAGARPVVEVEAADGKLIRTWHESYDSQGRVIRVHPKKPQNLGHIEIDPMTGKEIERW
ncbi:MAG: hypothetical protein GDA56_29590 [Hormoscilla sp. GM7CHS1pb]|nr:hypothetical protein [Hormoscilla sp. GM7CHS1pb]